MIPSKKITARNYVSYLVTPWNAWFKEMGYPELDVVTFGDGERAIIEYLKAPVVPAQTPWNYVLTKLRNMDLGYDYLKAWADQLCLEKRHVWEEAKAREENAVQELLERDRRGEDFINRAHKVISKNPALMERIAKNGAGELSLKSLWRHIPRSRLGIHGV